MFIGFDTFTQTPALIAPPALQAKLDPALAILAEALIDVCNGNWDHAAETLSRNPKAMSRSAAYLNLIGVVCQARRQWRRARRFYGKAMRCDRSYAPAEQNMRRIYELFTFGVTNLP